MENDRVSVITVCYNAERLLEDTIKSVLVQNYDNIEYIIVDGASKDNSLNIIKKYNDKITCWISEPDKGIYDAMNKGVKLATGDWIAFMNAGDTYVDENVISDIFRGKTFSSEIKVIGGHIYNHTKSGVEVHKAMSADFIPFGIPICHQASFTRRLLEGDIPFSYNTHYRYAADYAMFYYIYFNCGKSKAFHIDDVIVANCYEEESVTAKNMRDVIREYLCIQSAHPSLTWLKSLIKWLIKR